MRRGTGDQIHDNTVSQRKLGSGWPLAMACFMARSAAKLASIKTMVPLTWTRITIMQAFTEKLFIA